MRRLYKLTVFRKAPMVIEPLRIVTTTPLPKAFRDQPYPVTFAAEGGKLPYTWKIMGPNPPGLTLTPEGTIAGTPTQEGKHSFTIQVQSSNNDHAKATFTIEVTIDHPPPPPAKTIANHHRRVARCSSKTEI